jgi:hypothetical protein
MVRAIAFTFSKGVDTKILSFLRTCCACIVLSKERVVTTPDNHGQYNKQTQPTLTSPKLNAGRYSIELQATMEHNSTHQLMLAAPTT